LSTVEASSWIGSLAASLRTWSRDLSNRSLAICLAVGFFACLVVFCRPPLLFDFLWDQDNRLQDRFFTWRNNLGGILGYQPISPDDIVIVGIDADSTRKFGIYPPWPRQLYAALVRELIRAGASVVAFDLIFDGPSSLNAAGDSGSHWKPGENLPPALAKTWQNTPGLDDQALTEALRGRENVVLATNVEVSTSLFTGRSRLLFHTPYEQFVLALGADAGSMGNVVVEPDKDGVVRKGALVFERFRNLGPFFQSFALRAAEKKLNSRAIFGASRRVYFYERTYPESFRINFLGPAGTFKAIPFWKVLQGEAHYGPGSANDRPAGAGRRDTAPGDNPFQDKIVLVGFHQPPGGQAPGGERTSQAGSLPLGGFLTPVSGITRPMSGVELQANIIANILSAQYLAEPEWWEHALILIFVALLFARIFSGLHGKPFSMLLSIVAFGAIWTVDSFLCFAYLNCLIPVMVPIFGVALPAFFLVLTDQNLFAFRERRRHTRLFRALASDRLAGEIDRRQLGELGLEGKRATVTTLVCQVHNLAALTEGKNPQSVVSMVNQYLSTMMSVVYEHNGLVVRVWSHGIQAIWGAPIAMQERSQARLAANCCIEMQRRLAELSDGWGHSGRLAPGAPALECSYGITTGAAICGRIGTESHTEYGAIGKSVDLAARLQALNRLYGTGCLAGQETVELTGEQFEVRELDKVKLDQSEPPLRIFEILCPRGKLPAAMEEAIAVYRQALAAMEERNFAEAEKLFGTVLRIAPEDCPARLLSERCRHLIAAPPEPNWDGATLVISE
jgi:CHASE2 domain-containing sensor protein